MAVTHTPTATVSVTRENSNYKLEKPDKITTKEQMDIICLLFHTEKDAGTSLYTVFQPGKQNPSNNEEAADMLQMREVAFFHHVNVRKDTERLTSPD